MKKNHWAHKNIGLVALLPLVIAIFACSFITGTDTMITETQTIALEGAETVSVALRMGAGELVVSGGGNGLVDAEFTYKDEDWKPIIDYATSGSEGTLSIEQPQATNLGLDNDRYGWDLQFNTDILYSSLEITLGAGSSEINLSQLAVSRLYLQLGAGQVELDLTGSREIDLEGNIRAGVGQLTILLPEDIGVVVDVDGGIGSINTDGLNQTAQGYVNDAYGTTENTIRLDIEGGVGEINLRVVR